jgi:hypothetical protein
MPPGPALLAARRSLAAIASTCSGLSPITNCPRASTAAFNAPVKGPPKNVRPMPSTPSSVPSSSVTNSRVSWPTGSPTTKGLSAGVRKTRVFTCVTFILCPFLIDTSAVSPSRQPSPTRRARTIGQRSRASSIAQGQTVSEFTAHFGLDSIGGGTQT